MHSMNVMHRDIKLQNLMLATKGADPEIKIIDFGMSKRMRSSNEQGCQFVIIFTLGGGGGEGEEGTSHRLLPGCLHLSYHDAGVGRR